MKKILVAAAFAMALLTVGCAKVPAGHVAVKFHLYGDDKGVRTQELPPGRYWVSWNEEVYKFPTFTQTRVWDGDESFEFSDRDGTTISTGIGVTYRVDPNKVTDIFQTYRKGLDEITNLFLRNMIRDALVKRAGVLPADQLYGPGKAQLMDDVQADVIAQTKELGIVIEKVYLTGTMNLPPQVREAIDAKIRATQFAHQRQNEVAAAKAEADKEIEKAKGDSESTLLRAQAEAEAIRIKGEALRQNPSLVSLMWVEKWDGKVPVYQLGNNSSTLIGLPDPK